SRFTLTIDPSGSTSGNYVFTNNSFINLGNVAVEVNVTDSANLMTSTIRWFTYIIGSSVTIDHPAVNGDVDSGAYITINGTADGGGVNIDQVWINDTRFTLTLDPSGSPSGNYGFQNVSFIPDGDIAINVTVNNTGGLSDSMIRWFDVDNTYPTISIFTPASNGVVVSGNTIVISGLVNGTGSIIQSVMINDSRFTLQPGVVGTPSGTYTFLNNSYVADGVVAIEVNITDTANLTVSTTRWFRVDNAPPTISITDPALNGDIDSGAVIEISGIANGTGSDIDSVKINDTRFLIFIDPSGLLSGNYQFRNISYITNGIISVEVNVTDTAGFTSLTNRWFIVDNAYPTISVTDPASNGDFDTGTIISISGNANGTGTNIFSVMINDSRFTIFTDPSGTISGLYEFRNNTFIPDGNIAIEVNVTDSASLTTSTTRWFYIDNTYPIIYTTKPYYNDTIQVGNTYQIEGFVNGTGSLIDSVTINDSRFLLDINPNGTNWGVFAFVNITSLPDGPITLILSVNDTVGLTSNFTINFTVLQISNDTTYDLYKGLNILYLTDSKGNIVGELRIFVSSNTNINMTYYPVNPTGISLSECLSVFKFALYNQNALDNATMKLYYNESALGSISETNLKVFYLNGINWMELNATINITGNYLEWFTRNLSFYAIAPISVEEDGLFPFIPPGPVSRLIEILIFFGIIGAVLFAIIIGIARRKPKKVKRRRPEVKEKIIPLDAVEDEVLKDFFKQDFTLLSKEEIIRIMNLDIPNESEKLDILEELAGLPPKKRKKIIDALENIEDNF
ncbi:MAG: hypothetical protein HWN67_12350, partial [Candidatus Helarchaeota archaeon]|nr:hypothetical protein [Candidatus Helarchaeota archaeon]